MSDPPFPRYAIVSPVRDEAATIRCTAASVLAQSAPPVRWVIVDDGSALPTREVLAELVRRIPCLEVVRLEDRGHRAPGPGVVRALERGFEALRGLDVELIAKLDGDVELPPRYYERIGEAFAREPRLGIASGTCAAPTGRRFRLERHAPLHTRGPCKVYRRSCLAAIGGLLPVLGWDGLDGVAARLHGFETRTLPGLIVIHHRPTHAGDGALRGGMRAGRGAYNQHYRLDYLLARAARLAIEPPRLVGSLGLLLGYAKSALSGAARPEDPALRAQIRREQRFRLWGR